MTVKEIVTEMIWKRIADDRLRGLFVHWTIFDRPLDYPNSLIVRRFIIEAGKATPDDAIVAAPEHLEVLRIAFAQCGLDCIARSEMDHPNVVETWL